MDETTRLVYAVVAVGILALCGMIAVAVAVFAVAEEIKALRR